MSLSNNKMFLKKAVVVLTVTPALSWGLTDSNMNSLNTSKISSFSFESGFEYSQKVAEGEAAPREESVDLTLAPAYRFNESYKLTARSILSKENTGSGEAQISDTTFSLSIKGFEITPNVNSVHSISGVIPTSVDSREQNRLQGGIGFSNGLHYGGTKLDLIYRLGYTHFIHEFNLNAQGSPNVQHNLSHSISLQWKFSDKFSFSSLGVYRWGLTYGRKERSSFEVHNDLNYDFTKTMSLNVGTSTAGQALRANGVTSNLSIFDENRAVIRAGISMSL